MQLIFLVSFFLNFVLLTVKQTSFGKIYHLIIFYILNSSLIFPMETNFIFYLSKIECGGIETCFFTFHIPPYDTRFLSAVDTYSACTNYSLMPASASSFFSFAISTALSASFASLSASCAFCSARRILNSTISGASSSFNSSHI